MKAIAAAAGVDHRVDVFYLDDAASMHWLSPAAVPALGGVFTSAPVAVSSYVQPPLVLEPEPVEPPSVISGLGVKASETPPSPAPAGQSPAGAAKPASKEARIIRPPGGEVVRVQQLDVFGLGLDYAMYHKRLFNDDANNTSPWPGLGGVFTSTPAAIAWGSDRVDVFGVGMDRAMYTKTLIGSEVTPNWENLGGVFTSAATVVSQTAGQLDLFARGPDFTLRHNQLNGSQWFGWQNLGGNLASPPVAVSWGENRVDVFAIFNDRALWHRWWDGQIWNDWESLAGAYSEEPAVATWGVGRLDVFVLGDPHLAGDKPPDRDVYHYWFSDGAWSQPVALKSPNPNHAVFGAPTVVASGVNRLTVFAPGLEDPGHDGSANQTLLQLSSSTDLWGDGPVGSSTGPVGWGTRLDGPLHLPNQGIVSVDNVKAIEQRSGAFESDTDYASASLAVGNWPSVTAVQFMGDISTDQESQTNLLSLGPTTMELAELVSFNYLVVNNGSAAQAAAMAALAQGGNTLNAGSVTSISTQIQSGVTKIVEVGIDSVLKEVPVVGSIVGPIANWLIDQLATIVFAKCDGLVAAELMVFPGKPDPTLQLTDAPVTHPGTDSATGCGDNSVYEVWRTVQTGITSARLNA